MVIILKKTKIIIKIFCF